MVAAAEPAPRASGVDIRILGPLEVWRDGGPVRIGAGRERAVLTALILRANRVVSTDRLVEAIWGAAPPATARNTLHSLVRRLRRRLESPGSGRILVTEPPGYALRVESDRIDLYRFEVLAERGSQALRAGDVDGASRLLGEALALWRGRALSGVPTDGSLRLEAVRLEERYLQAAEERVDAELRRGRYGDMVGELRGLTHRFPLHERFYGLLMTALHGCGRQADALQTYRTLREVLVAELGVEPGPDTQALHQSILRGDAAAGRARPSAESDGYTPVTLTPEQLPVDIAGFSGREDQLRQLDRVLAGPSPGGAGHQGARIAVIAVVAGTAGVGKTALAVRWAHRVRGEFPDGQLYVDLRGFGPGPPMRPFDVLTMFLRALGIPATRTPGDEQEAAAMYRTLLAGRRLLVVLDNACGADQVRPLLPGGAGCRVVITSRDRLDGLVVHEGAVPLRLDVLSPDEAHALLDAVLGAGRSRSEPGPVAELARLCAYLPLALRIAAANIAAGGPGGVAAYLARLRAGSPVALLRIAADDESAIRVTFDRSYAALPRDARRLFRLMGLVPGPDTTLEAAARLVDAPTDHVRGLLERLVSGHLVHEPVVGRFTSHDLLRRHAADTAQAEDTPADREAALDRLFAWYLTMADAAARQAYPERLRLPPTGGDASPAAGPRDAPAAMAWLDAERRNLVLAAHHAATDQAGTLLRPYAWRLADALRGYFAIRLHLPDWLAVADAALIAAEDAQDRRAQAASRLSLAEAHWRRGDHDEAVRHYTSAAELSHRTGWTAGEAAALGNLGTVYRQSGHLETAADHYTRALTLNRRIGRPEGRAASLGNLGTAYWELGQPERAAEHFAEALELYRSTGSTSGQAIALNNLADALRARGQHAEALAHANRALALLREVGNRSDESETLRIMAEIHREAGRAAEALTCGSAAAALAHEAGDRRLESLTRTTLGAVLGSQGHHGQALRHHRHALRLAQDTGNRYPAALALIRLAETYEHLGQPDLAAEHAQRALRITRDSGYRMLEHQAQSALASRPGPSG